MYQALQNVHKALQILVEHESSKDCEKAYNTQKMNKHWPKLSELSIQSGALWSILSGLPLPHQLSNRDMATYMNMHKGWGEKTHDK